MRKSRKSVQDNIYEIFSDMALLMLSAFIFLFAVMVINTQLHNGSGGGSDASQQELEQLKELLAAAESRNERLQEEMVMLAGSDLKQQEERILETAGLSKGQGRKDFDLFVKGLRDLPGPDVHLLVDGTGSMHGVTTFLIPVLRVIAIRSGKYLSGVTWYADSKSGTYTGTMGEMFDRLMQEAPFVGTDETIGHAFRDVAKNATVPGAYILIGDEPPTDKIHYSEIPAPVFTLPLGVDNSSVTKVAFRKISDQTGGRMLQLRFE